MPEKILEAKGQAVVSGQHPSLPNQQIPLWEKGNNVLYEDLAVKPAPGQQMIFAKQNSLPVLGYLSGQSAGVPWLVWGDREKLWRGDTPPDTDEVTRAAGVYTGTDDDPWSFAQFGEAILATNGVDEIQYYPPGGPDFVNFSSVSDLPNTFRAKILRNIGAFILAFNTDNDSAEYRWCDEDNVLVWTPTPQNKSRDILIRDMKSDIVAVEELGEGLFIAGRQQAHYTQFAGPPFFFPNRHLVNGVGAIGQKSVVVVGRNIFGFGRDGIWRTDGSGIAYIDDPSMHKFIYTDTLDKALIHRTVAWEDSDNNIIYFSFPRKGGGGFTVGYNYNLGIWSMHDYWRTAADSGSTWGQPITGDAFGNVWAQGIGNLPISGEPKPLLLNSSAGLQSGYGRMGYGRTGYGGAWDIF